MPRGKNTINTYSQVGMKSSLGEHFSLMVLVLVNLVSVCTVRAVMKNICLAARSGSFDDDESFKQSY